MYKQSSPSNTSFIIQEPNANITLLARSAPPNLEDTITQIIPKAIRWKCCICDQSYNIGATSKCLDCGHQFCHNLPNGSMITSERKPITCEVNFDDKGWEAYYNQQRRNLTGKDPDVKSHLPISRDCYTWCKYPSECKKHEREQLSSAYELLKVEKFSGGLVSEKEVGSLGLRNIFDVEAEEDWYSAGF